VLLVAASLSHTGSSRLTVYTECGMPAHTLLGQRSPQGADRVKPMLAPNCFVISPTETLIEEIDGERTAAEGFWPVPLIVVVYWLLMAARYSIAARLHFIIQNRVPACLPWTLCSEYTRCWEQMWHVSKKGVLYLSRLWQCFSTFVRPRPGKFLFYKTRARSQQIYS